MNKKDLDKIKLPDNLDNIIEDAINMAEEDKKKGQGSKGYKKGLGTIVAGLAIVTTLGIGTTTLVYGVPSIRSAFEKMQNFLTFKADYFNHATEINEKVYDNGLGITISEILCDGQNLYITYVLESKEPFKYLDEDEITQLNSEEYKESSKRKRPIWTTQVVDEETVAKVSFTDEELDNSGVAGLEGTYLDDHTFVGVEQYKLSSLKAEIPDEFEFTVNYKKFSGPWPRHELSSIEGNWSFKVPVKVDKSLVKKIEVNDIGEEGIGVKEISVTPFEIRILTGYRNDNNEYWIRVYDEEGNILEGGSEEYFPESNIMRDYSMAIVPRGDTKFNKIKVELYKPYIDENGKEYFEHPGEEILYSKKISLE